MWISKPKNPSIAACNLHVSILTEAECCANTITALSLDITMCSNTAPARYNLLLIKANTETIDNVTYHPTTITITFLWSITKCICFSYPPNIQLICNLFTWLPSTDFFQLSVRQCCYHCQWCHHGCVSVFWKYSVISAAPLQHQTPHTAICILLKIGSNWKYNKQKSLAETK